MCQHCSKVSTLGSWNDKTYSQCTEREMRKTFRPLMAESSFKRESDVYYMCPICKKWSRGSQLVIVSDDPKLKALGGESIIDIE